MYTELSIGNIDLDSGEKKGGEDSQRMYYWLYFKG